MMVADLLRFASPEWSALEEGGVLTSQYGAYLSLKTQDEGTLTLTFAKHYPNLVWTVTIDGEKSEELLVVADHVSVHLQAGHYYQLTLDQWATGQVDFWRTGLVLADLTWSGDEELLPVLPKDGEATKPYLTFVGDSIVAGEAMAGPNHDRHQPALSFPALVANHFDRPLNRIAYGGTGLTARAPFQEPKAIDALWQVGEGISRRRVVTDRVIVAYGLNDANYGASDQEFAFGLRVYLLELVKRFHGADFYLLTPWNGAFVDIVLAEVARFSNFTVVRADQWGIQTRPYHPDVLAHQKIAEQLVAVLEE
ncbi:lysophospholipase [Fructobacillus tropaeoli]|uniref:lysophospholipase n=1 Tax=Fructobacillus tropaeoli TaxID=709323 RepID=UPI001455E681|nr:lysophospholipase [Fructobacillus tropaeoli]NLS37985.1 lysophospholipase [Fructobacillus tropaeoli]